MDSKTGNNIGRKKLYKQYSYLGKKTKDIKRKFSNICR